MNKYFLPYDVFERHKKVASYIGSDNSVLDIGGELNHLSQFCKPRKIIVANLNTGDVLITKNKIPFKNNSFDIVCSIDVLEHIPKSKRKDFINKLTAISKKTTILSFPIGTKKHIEYETRTKNWLKTHGQDVTYLNEHIKNGLPTTEEIESLTRGTKSDIDFSGDIRMNDLLFKIFMFDPRIKGIRKLVYIIKHIFNAITNNLFFSILSSRKYSENANRAYVRINK